MCLLAVLEVYLILKSKLVRTQILTIMNFWMLFFFQAWMIYLNFSHDGTPIFLLVAAHNWIQLWLNTSDSVFKILILILALRNSKLIQLYNIPLKKENEKAPLNPKCKKCLWWRLRFIEKIHEKSPDNHNLLWKINCGFLNANKTFPPVITDRSPIMQCRHKRRHRRWLWIKIVQKVNIKIIMYSFPLQSAHYAVKVNK